MKVWYLFVRRDFTKVIPDLRCADFSFSTTGTVSQMKDASCEAIRSASELCYDKGKTVSWGHLEQKCCM